MPSLLEYSAYWGAIDIFKFLMMNGAKLGNKTVNYAILGGNLEILHLLEDANCSFDASLCAAIQDQRDDILDYIIDNKNISFDSDSVCSAIVNLNYRVISRVLDFLYDHPNDFDNDGITPLIYASINNNIMLVQLLLSIPSIDPNLPDSSNNNFPLLAAARCNSVDALQLLLKEPKIKINQINYLNHSAIMGGSIFGHLKIVEILGQQKSIDFNIFDHYQRNAFHLATVADRLDIVKYFMNSNKIQINVQDSFQNSHFIIAVEIENWKIVEYFLSVCKTCANIDSICSEIPSMEIKRKFQVLLLKYRNKLCQ
ncbi:hypothetical protein TRFO_38008 [Tritrichomonas foetus]|uniref:Uncharacterized protein n=1 Tax=Tritrichomonas foetus TaxID=1144522 RepID=A0A1J4JB04_9EUKA|nr:hypothetical protein TRFO_38008 [Tritrichomonas foetus]|eukprot:OHS95849.1 hypothetical protein TRFO_38008 [Tritrichomonas foetus]